ncbi:hypothetical protein ADL22_12665 [Streptomyces sp. NRRL F-4489]|uniref:hypothetical protein n=1 Tax=Streptomyces sp. NRRL F-4489 TaxID=1609095 RepID=UPI00074A7D58|nr:hypothetical protein [Streptomyces sp. NRRL F-4489]KUL44789.1 hypothetical protein ADL22_12665 [Streptomyces sp. NRRL F-4489]
MSRRRNKKKAPYVTSVPVSVASAPSRQFWTTATVRAEELLESDTIKVDGKWREVFDVWKEGDDVAGNFGDDSDLTKMIMEKTDWMSPCWVAVRYVDEEKSTANEIESGLAFFTLRDLVEIQVPAGQILAA